MRVQSLGSGSEGNATLVRNGETHVLIDAGLPLDVLEARLEAARVPASKIDHVVLTHGHLDHARAAGALSRKARATVHCPEAMMQNASIRQAHALATLPIGGSAELADARGRDALELTTTPVPHDAHPTVAVRLEANGRRFVLVTDMGRPTPEVARRLGPADLLFLEFNHELELLRSGPYPSKLKRRVAGDQGHLSNAQAAEVLAGFCHERLHTLVLTHLSATNNEPGLARAAAERVLDRHALDVRLCIAEQHELGPNLEV